MTRRKVDAVPQRQLALRLRYHIDCIMRGHDRERHESEVAALALDNPTSLRSSHVAHNVGAARLAWMEDRGYLP